jgi:hypothetical protein
MSSPTGRHTKLTPALQLAIVQAITSGVPLSEAAHLAGVAAPTVLEWIARGEGRSARPATAVYADFAEALTRAKAVDIARRVARIELAGRGGQVLSRKTTTLKDGTTHVEERFTAADWQADAWHLERSRPDDWGRKERVDVRVTIERLAAQVAQSLGLPLDEVLAEAEALLREASDARPH